MNQFLRVNQLTYKSETKIKSIEKDQDKWQIIDDKENNLGSYDWVICAIPPEQASDLIPHSTTLFLQINSIKMQGCLSLMLGFEKPLDLDFDAALIKGEDISWISVNSSKPSRNEAFCLLINSTNKWADEHMDDDRNWVMNYLCDKTSQIIGCDLSVAQHKSIHGWRYANIQKQEGEKFLIDESEKIAVCGDWLIKSRMESAFLSGFKAANKILEQI